jgi:hypothetical protein
MTPEFSYDVTRFNGSDRRALSASIITFSDQTAHTRDTFWRGAATETPERDLRGRDFLKGGRLEIHSQAGASSSVPPA